MAVPSDPLAEAIVASLHEGLLVVDGDGRISRANEAAAALFGVDLSSLVGARWSDVGLEDALVQRALGGETVRGALVQLVRPDGTTAWAEVHATPFGGGAVSTYADVTERVNHERRVHAESHRDALTGLANRAGMERVLEAAVARARRDGREVAVLALDLDRFRMLNDRWGHLAGDHALRSVAGRLARCVRERDLVARTEDDEFVLVLPDLAPAAPTARECMTRVGAALAAPVRFEGGSTTLSASCGVATFPGDAADAVGLVAHAESALGGRQRRH